ncbi:MAG: MmcQ/YjbR family DNA-binding protein [Clostridiales bacterium]|nr:MmcQ/YjbR family DNA-binding protein [Clostridiales bacterium]
MNRQILFEYAKNKYGTEPEFLWRRYPSYAVLRHSDNKKWYGVVMDVERNKLGLEGGGKVDILDIKCEGLMTDILRTRDGFLTGYHMNKKYWISVLLDGTVSESEVFSLLDMSFELTSVKKKKT